MELDSIVQKIGLDREARPRLPLFRAIPLRGRIHFLGIGTMFTDVSETRGARLLRALV